MLGGAYRMQMRATDRVQLEQSVDRLASRLRQDAHAAAAVEAMPGGVNGSGVILQMPDGTSITYELAEGGVSRLVKREDMVVHRDRFSLPGCVVRLVAEAGAADGAAGPNVLVSIESKATHPEAAPARFEPIHAAVGLHRAPAAAEDES